ncbi:DinB family protein [Chloroflexota bacterium]
MSILSTRHIGKGLTMEWQELLIDGYGRIFEILERSLNGLTQDDLNQQPKPDCNSMGWLAWHLTRVQDGHIADLTGENQLWISEGWHTKFNRAMDPKDTGFGHTPKDVAAFKSPDVETLLGYHHAVMEQTKRYISSLSGKDLDRELNEPWYQPLPTVGVRLISVMADNLQHAGQITYVRGFLKGKGWTD